MDPLPETVSIREAASALDVHPNTIRNYLSKHYLGYVQRPSGQRRVLKVDLDRLRREMFSGPPIEAQPFDEVSWDPDDEGVETIAFME